MIWMPPAKSSTTDGFTVRLDDGSGMVVNVVAPPHQRPGHSTFPTGVTWGPRRPEAPLSGSLELSPLPTCAFTGIDVPADRGGRFRGDAADWADHQHIRRHPADPWHRGRDPARTWAAGARLRRCYPPRLHPGYPGTATDPSVHTDGFTIAVDDGRGGLTTASVPVVIVKSATVTAANEWPAVRRDRLVQRPCRGALFDHVEDTSWLRRRCCRRASIRWLLVARARL